MADPVLVPQAQDLHALPDSVQDEYHHKAPAHETDVEFRIGNHNHFNTNHHHNHNHQQQHIRSHIHNRRAHQHHRSPENAPLRLPRPPQLKRDAVVPAAAPIANPAIPTVAPVVNDNSPIANDDNDGPPITIHQTVSIVQVIDNAGAIVQVHTLPPNVAAINTANPAPLAQATAGVDVAVGVSAGLSVGASADLPPANVPTPTVSATAGLGVGLSIGLGDGTSSGPYPTDISSSPLMSTFPSLSYSHVTATPLSHPPAFSSIPGASNSTQGMSPNMCNYIAPVSLTGLLQSHLWSLIQAAPVQLTLFLRPRPQLRLMFQKLPVPTGLPIPLLLPQLRRPRARQLLRLRTTMDTLPALAPVTAQAAAMETLGVPPTATLPPLPPRATTDLNRSPPLRLLPEALWVAWLASP